MELNALIKFIQLSLYDLKRQEYGENFSLRVSLQSQCVDILLWLTKVVSSSSEVLDQAVALSRAPISMTWISLISVTCARFVLALCMNLKLTIERRYSETNLCEYVSVYVVVVVCVGCVCVCCLRLYGGHEDSQ